MHPTGNLAVDKYELFGLLRKYMYYGIPIASLAACIVSSTVIRESGAFLVG